MKSRIAIKKLTPSDLTLFKEIFEREDSNSKQKSINLNANPFTSSFYPNLDELAVQYDRRFGIDLHIYGPDYNYPVHILQRKIVKSAKGKNWRLNGEFAPYFEDTERYSILSEDDIAIIKFIGINKPERIKLLLISSTLSPSMHSFLLAKFDDSSRQTMIEITDSEVAEWNTRDDFKIPRNFLLSERFIADNILSGQIENSEESLTFTNRYMSASDLKAGKKEAEKIGMLGEQFVNQYLSDKYGEDNYEWSSSENPISPFDFQITTNNGFYLDVKSTRGEFNQSFYMSLNEIKAAARLPEYRIFRVYEVEDKKCGLWVSKPIKNVCLRIIASLESIPPGIKPTAMSIKPTSIDWEINTKLELEE